MTDEAILVAIRGLEEGRPDWWRVVRDFPEISDPRLARIEIPNAQIRDKMPLAGLEPATLANAAQTRPQLTKWSGRGFFFAPCRWLNFLTRFRQRDIFFV